MLWGEVITPYKKPSSVIAAINNGVARELSLIEHKAKRKSGHNHEH